MAAIGQRTLLIVEVLRHVCQFAKDDTLAALARVCKSFHDPAIQTLWSDLQNLTPLIKCFPDNIWTVDTSSDQIVS